MVTITQKKTFIIVAATHHFSFDEQCNTSVDLLFCSNANAYRCKITNIKGERKNCNQTSFAVSEGCDKDIKLPLGYVTIKLLEVNTDAVITNINAFVQKAPIIEHYPC